MIAKWKIIAGCIAMIVVMGLVAAAGYFGLADMTEAFNEYRRMSRLSVSTSDMVARQLGATAEMRQFLMHANPEAMQRARDEIRAIRRIVEDGKNYARRKDIRDVLNAMDGQTAQQMRLSEALEKSVTDAVRRYEEDVRPALRRLSGELLVLIRSDGEENVRIHAVTLDHLGVVSAALSRFAYNRTRVNAGRAEEALAELGRDIEEIQGTPAAPEGSEQFAAIRKACNDVMAASAAMRTSVLEGMERTAQIVALNHAVRESISRISDDAGAQMEQQGAAVARVNEAVRKSEIGATAAGLTVGILLAAVVIIGLVRVLRSAIYNQDALREAEERIQIMLDASPFSLTMWDKNLNVIDCSRSAVELFGFSGKRDLFERNASCLPECQPNGRRSQEMLAEEMTRAFETGGNRLEWTQRKANGELGIFDLSFVRAHYKGDYALLIYARDIGKEKEMLTELARRDEMLAAQTHWYRSLLDAIPLPLSVTDADMKLTFVNAAAEKLFGTTREELLGKPCSCWNVPICGTAGCSVLRAKRGLTQTYFKHDGVSCLVDTEIIRDTAGALSGFIEILHDVTGVEKAARQQADEANEAKSAFLATISHEMRTPLNAVIGLSELTLGGGGLNEEAEANIENIHNAGSTLLSIVNDILDLSKIKSGKFEIIPHRYDVPSMINDAVAQNLLRIGSKPVRFVLDIDENMPSHLYGDDLRVKQIITNLLSNAFKYTEKGTVTLALSHERENESVRLTIRVSDTGVGIRPEDHALLFADYAQIDAKANRKAGGTGLGLSITKSLTRMMEGDIAVASAYGEGSVFTATLRQGFVSDGVIGAEVADNLKNFRPTGKRGRNARLNRIRLPYARVLVVDDHPTNLDVAKGLMKPYGMRIDCAASGQEAIDAIREERVRYSAVFMDHMMPGMDGMEATRRIREIGTEYARTIPIIALTANAIVGAEEMFLHNGFTAFLSKPIDLARLDETLRRHVRDREQEALLDRGALDMRQGRDRREGKERREGRDRRFSGKRDLAGPLSSGKTIYGLDVAKGLERFGEEESYAQVLRSYAVNTKPLLASIETVNRENLHGYAITVHGIKGSSRGIGAEPVGNLAEALEYAAKSGDFDFVRDNNPAFLESAKGLVDRIETLLNGMPKSGCRPKRDKPDSALLAKLKTACDSYELEGIDAVMREIDEYEYTADEGLAEWLRDSIARLNYTQIAEKITQL